MLILTYDDGNPFSVLESHTIKVRIGGEEFDIDLKADDNTDIKLKLNELLPLIAKHYAEHRRDPAGD